MAETCWLGRSVRPLVLAAVTTGLVASAAAGEPVVTVRRSGNSANRVDIAILGDGYTAGEMSKYRADVSAVVTGIFNQDPFRTYQAFFNIHRVDVVSAESGADKPVEGIFRDTALGASYYCAGIERLICVDSFAVDDVLAASLRVDQRDLIVILVNDNKYGGSGGAFAVLSRHPSSIEIALHEIGHTLGLLADEYDYGPPPCTNSFEPFAANVTRQTNRALIKWTAWIDPTTPVPTTTAQLGIPGLYRGAMYCASGLYRPTFNSKMRSLNRPFEQINTEELIKRFYNFVSPIDAASPDAFNLIATLGETKTFAVQTPKASPPGFDISWQVDSRPAGQGKTFTVDTRQTGRGSHLVRVTVSDLTPFVRNDPYEMLRESQTWLLRVNSTVDGDVDGDGAVTCGDVAVVRASFGKRFGSPGFDRRADWNDDGVISVYDLAYVTQRLPPGTQCR